MDLSDEEFDLSEELEKYRNVVLSACTSLGGLEKVKISSKSASSEDSKINQPQSQSTYEYEYIRGDECIDCLKDLKRYIRIDEMSGEKLVLQWLADWQVFGHDLLPIFKISARNWLDLEEFDDKPWYRVSEGRDDEYKILCLCVDLFVFMTWNMDHGEPEVREKFVYILRNYKKFFCDNEVVSLFVQIITRLFEIPAGWRQEKDRMLLQGSLYVLRNLLGVQDPYVSSGVYGTNTGLSGLQDWLIQIMNDEYGIELLIVSASMMDDKNVKSYASIILDIFYCLYQRVSVDTLTKSKSDISSLDLISTKASSRGFGSTRPGRHSRFGGVFAGTIEPGKLIPIFNAAEAMKTFAQPLKKQRNALRRKVNIETEISIKTMLDDEEREVSPEVLAILKNTSFSFLKSCFGSLFPPLLEDIEFQRNTLDEVGRLRLLYMAGHFIEFFSYMYQIQQKQVGSKLYGNSGLGDAENKILDFPYISSVANQGGIGMCLRQMSDGIESENWPKAQAAMYCFRSMLKAVKVMSNSNNPEYQDSSTYIQSNLFYDGNVMDLVVRISGSFKPTKHTLRYIIEIIRTVDEFIVCLESYSSNKQNMYIKRKAKKAKKRKANTAKDEESKTDIPEQGDNPIEVDEEFEGIGSDGSTDDESYRDVRFDYESWQKAFALKSVANTYCNAFKACLLLKGSELKMVSKMIYRIAVVARKPYLFFERKTFTQFYQFLINYQNLRKSRSYDAIWIEALAELQDDVAWIFRKYFETETNQKVELSRLELENAAVVKNEAITSQDLEFDDLLDRISGFQSENGIEDNQTNVAVDGMDSTSKADVAKKDPHQLEVARLSRYKQNLLFEEETSYVRVRKYLKDNALGTNPQRYPLKYQLDYYSSDSNGEFGVDAEYDKVMGYENGKGAEVEDESCEDELEELKALDTGFLTWKDKISVIAKILAKSGKKDLLDILVKELSLCIVERAKESLPDALASKSANPDLDTGSDNSDDDIMLRLRTPDYAFSLPESETSASNSENQHFLELLSLLRINKDSSGSSSNYVIYGFESTLDIQEKSDLLKTAADASILTSKPKSSKLPSKKTKLEEKHTSLLGKKVTKPRDSGKKRSKASIFRQANFAASGNQNIFKLDPKLTELDSTRNRTDNIQGQGRDQDHFSNDHSLQGYKSKPRPGPGSGSESDSNPIKNFLPRQSQRSNISSELLLSSDEEDDLSQLLLSNSKNINVTGSGNNNDKSNDSRRKADRINSRVSFKERALMMRKRLITEKNKRVLVKGSKYNESNNATQDDQISLL